MAKEIITINPREFKISQDPNQTLYTDWLDSCVGLALIENKGKKRGLAHVYYDGLDNFIITSQDVFLEKFLSNFSNPQAYITYVRHKFDKNAGYENLMANHVNRYLTDKGIQIKLVDGQKEFNKREIHHKEIAVHDKSLDIIYRNGTGALLNHPCSNIKFD